jgi:6-phosphogluconolactonase
MACRAKRWPWWKGWKAATRPISPDNRTLWVPALKQDRICLFTLSDDGFLAAQEPAEVTTVEGAGPRHMVFHPNQQYGYCVNELNSSTSGS